MKLLKIAAVLAALVLLSLGFAICGTYVWVTQRQEEMRQTLREIKSGQDTEIKRERNERARQFLQQEAAAAPPPELARRLEIREALSDLQAPWRKDERWQWVSEKEHVLEEASAEEWADLAAYLAEYSDLFMEIHRLAKAGVPWYELRWEDGLGMDTSHAWAIRSMGWALRAQAFYQKHQGDADAAFETILTRHQLAEIVSDEPLLMSQFMRLGVHRNAMYDVGRLFEPGELTEAQQHTLLELYRDLDLKAAVEPVIEEQLASAIFILQLYREEEHRLQFGNTKGRLGRGLAALYRSPLGSDWAEMDQAMYAAKLRKYVPLRKQPYYLVKEELAALEAELDTASLLHPYIEFLSSSEGKYLKQIVLTEALRELTMIGLSIEAQRGASGKYPPTLQEIEGPVPVDPFSGKSYTYVPGAYDFLLYSVGLDGEDDGGRQNFEDGDLVWRGIEARRSVAL